MKTLMTVCICALIAMPPVAFAQTATTTTETPAKTDTMPAPATATTPAETAPSVTPAPAVTPAPTTPATSSAAVDTATPEMDEVEYVTTETTDSIYSSDLVGQSVYGITEEETVGDINDLLLDQAGNVQGVIIGVGGFIGLGEKDVAVTLESLTITNKDGAYQISIRATEEELEAAPTYTRADGTSSDRLGAFERAYTRTRVEAEKALDEAGRRANELYEQGKKAVNDLTTTEPAATDAAKPAQ